MKKKLIVGGVCVLAVILLAKVAVSCFADVAEGNKQKETVSVSTPMPTEAEDEDSVKDVTELEIDKYVTFEQLPENWKIACSDTYGNLFYKNEPIAHFSVSYLTDYDKKSYKKAFRKEKNVKTIKYRKYTFTKQKKIQNFSEKGKVKNKLYIQYLYYQSDSKKNITGSYAFEFSGIIDPEDLELEQQLDQVVKCIKYRPPVTEEERR